MMLSIANMLPRDFYLRDTITVAKDLLGRYLVHQSAEGLTAGKIVETEAYLGALDKAAHSYKGRTKRNEVMYGPGGYAYVYLIYGMYYCFNIVTRDIDQPEAVLIRAIEPVCGIELMQKRRKQAKKAKQAKQENQEGLNNVPGSQAKLKNLCNGPGKLCQAMDIDVKRHNGADLCSLPLYLTRGEPACAEDIVATPRINIAYAEEAAQYPWRFIIK